MLSALCFGGLPWVTKGLDRRILGRRLLDDMTALVLDALLVPVRRLLLPVSASCSSGPPPKMAAKRSPAHSRH